MKILLVGEFSGFHLALRDGLIELGHEVRLVSSGDGWKNIDSDILFKYKFDNKFLAKIERNFIPFLNIREFVGFDIVQFVNVKSLSCSLITNYYLAKMLKPFNGKLVLSACGSDSFYWTDGRSNLKYSPHDDVLAFDDNNPYWLKNDAQSINAKMVKLVDAVIPVMYDYANAYRNVSNVLPIIPLPVNLDKIKFIPNNVRGSISFYHGINRYGFKGTRHIESAFSNLSVLFKGTATFEIKGRMPYVDYVNYIKGVNAIVDQTSSYSTGMNGLISMAMGKIVFGGSESIALEAMNVTECPIINIEPSSIDISEKISNFLDSKISVEDYAYLSRDYVEKVHSHKKIALAYIEQWSKL